MRAQLFTIATLGLRGAALFLAGITIVGLIGELRGRTLDVSLWWIDLRDLPAVVRLVMLAALAGLLAACAIHRHPARRLRWATAATSGVFAVFAIRDVVRFYSVVADGDVRPFVNVPLSLLIALLLIGLAIGAVRERREHLRSAGCAA